MADTIFYKYKSFYDRKGNDTSRYTLDSLEREYFYFSRPEQLNDPFDCRVINDYEATDEEIQKWIQAKPSRSHLTIETVRAKIDSGELKDTMDAAARRDEQHFHVLSLTDSWQNENLWANYASDYEGICLGYRSTFNDGSNDYIEAKSMISGIPILESFRNVGDKPFFELQKILYDNDGSRKYNIFKSSDKDNLENVEYGLLHKKAKWSGENEYRKIIMDQLDVSTPDTFIPKGPIGFLP